MRIAGASNLGPVIDRLSQTPALPAANEPVTVRARVLDPDGVASVVLRYALQSPNEAFRSVPMTGPDKDGLYSAEIPGQPLATIVVFEIIAADAGGRPGRYPLDHIQRTHPLLLDPEAARPEDHRWAVYGHAERPSSPYHDYRIWLHRENERFLSTRKVHSDDYVEASLVFEDERIYHGIGLHFQGSALSRGAWGSYRVRMADDQPLNGRWHRFNLDRDGANARDRVANYILRNNTGGLRLPYNEHTFTTLTVNSRPSATRVRIMPPGKEYLSIWFPDDDEGSLFEMDERYIFADGGTAQTRKNARWLYPPYRDEGPPTDKESYRFYFNPRTHKEADDFSAVIATARVLDPAATRSEEFDGSIDEHLDLEQVLRVLAVRQNTGDFDTWGGIFGRSAYIYRPADGRWRLFPWDSDITFGVDGRGIRVLPLPDDPSGLFANPFPEVQRLLNHPPIKRRYYAILKEMIDGRFTSAYLKPYMEMLERAGASPETVQPGLPGGWVDQRGALIRGWIEGAFLPEKKLEITTNGGMPFAVEEAVTTLAGEAPADVHTLLVLVNGSPLPDPSGARFSATAFFGWEVPAIPLAPGINTVEVLGLSSQGGLVDSDSIQIIRGASEMPPFIRGDCNGDGRVGGEVSDPIFLLVFSFQGGREPPCLAACDADGDGRVSGVTDAIFLLAYSFLGGSAPPAPFPGCGISSSAEDLLLGCEGSPRCP